MTKSAWRVINSATALFLILWTAIPPGLAQSGSTNNGKTVILSRNGSSTSKPGLTPNADQKRAIELLDQIFGQADDLKDSALRIRLKSQAANSLWDYDETKARRQFEDAFYSIDSLKPEHKQMGVVLKRADSTQFQLRNELLSTIATRDSELAKKLIASVVEEPLNGKQGTNGSGASANSSASDPAMGNQSEQSLLYLQAAMGLIGRDPMQAGRLIQQSIQNGIAPGLADVLLSLHGVNSSLADNLFQQAVAAAPREAAHPERVTDLLAPYVFPAYVSAKFGYGLVLDGVGTRSSEVNTSLAPVFLSYVYNAMAQRIQLDDNGGIKLQGLSSSTESTLDYFWLTKMQPYFASYMPQAVDSVKGWLDQVLASMTPMKASMSQALTAPESVDSVITQAESSQGDSRDISYSNAAYQAAQQVDLDRAIAISEKIKNIDFRNVVGMRLRAQAVISAIGKGNVDAAYDYTQALSNPQVKAVLLLRIGDSLVKKKNTGRAKEIYEEAEGLLVKAFDSPEVARAAMITANSMSQLDPERGFDMLRAAVESMNKTELRKSEPEPAETIAKLVWYTTNQLNARVGLDKLELDGVFTKMGAIDFQRTLIIAQIIDDKEFTLRAQLAACAGVLSTLKRDVPKKTDEAKKPAKEAATKKSNPDR